MHLKEIDLTNFKSYTKDRFEFSPILNVIYGRNGVGKTNLLDAIYTLAMTKSNFTIPDAQLIKNEADFYRLEGLLHKGKEDIRVVLKLPRGKKKVIERDQITLRRPLEHIGFMPVVMITPDDLELINASNSERRKLADSTLSQVDRNYLDQLILYNRLLKQRNMLLKQGLEHKQLDLQLLETYDRKMDLPSQIVYQQRAKFFSTMQELVQNYYQVLSAGGESVELIYVSHLADGSLSQLAQSSISRDRASGRTHKGVHRDVVTCLIDGKDARVFGSQGQKKSFIFAIKLAQLNFMQDQMADQPILLLDDIFDRLDHDRVGRLLHIILNDSFGQIFITDTQWERFNQILTSFTVSPTKIEIL